MEIEELIFIEKNKKTGRIYGGLRNQLKNGKEIIIDFNPNSTNEYIKEKVLEEYKYRQEKGETV